MAAHSLSVKEETAMILTTEIMFFIGTAIVLVVGVVLYMNGIDKRVAVLESTTLSKEEFHKGIDDLKQEITKIQLNK